MTKFQGYLLNGGVFVICNALTNADCWLWLVGGCFIAAIFADND